MPADQRRKVWVSWSKYLCEHLSTIAADHCPAPGYIPDAKERFPYRYVNLSTILSETGLTSTDDAKQPDPCIPSNIHQRKKPRSPFPCLLSEHVSSTCLADRQANDGQETVDSAPE